VDQNDRLVLSELEDLVEKIFSAIAELRESLDDGKTTRQLLESIFRNVHSLKASALANDLNDVSRIAHQFENLLHALRTGKARLDDQILRGFDDAADALFSSLNHREPLDSKIINSLLDRLARLSDSVARRRRAEVDIVLSALPSEDWQSLTDEEKHRLEESIGEGASLYRIKTDFDIASFDRQFQDLKYILTDKGEVISTAPIVDADRPDKINFRILYAREADFDLVSRELEAIPDVTVNPIGSAQPAGITNAQEAQLEAASYSAGNFPSKGTSKLIRINLDDLDQLISATHRLFRETTNGFSRAIQSLSGQTIQGELETVSTGVSESFMRLASALVNLRMVSIDRVLQRAVRAGRAAALAAGKEIEFTIRGRDLLLDKSVADAIANPLIHLMRNAVDHGIENVEQRIRIGKSKRGNVRIEAATLQGQTRITVTDDGRGIDPKLVTEAALRLGVVQNDSRLSVDQSVRLLFRPGFSTAQTVSGVSGRGVGLDVVETAIEEMGGAVSVGSEQGVGSSFQLHLPMSFGLLDVVMVSLGGRPYLVDASRVITSETVDSSQLVGSELQKGFRLGEQFVPLLHLGNLLGQEESKVADAQVGLLLFQSANQNSEETDSVQEVAILVDSILGTQQVLVRNLGSRGGRWFGVAGAAELGDGTVVLLLDLPRLIHGAQRSGS
jgi:two-component system chemotaxis sensor kinase CheA